MNENYGRSFLEVNTARLKANVKCIGGIAAPGVKLLAAVKANAYGHGMVPFARACLDAGVGYLGVSSVCEGVTLREAGINAPVLVMGAVFHVEHTDLISNNLVSAVFCLNSAKDLSESAKKMDKVAKVHIKVDSGMGRIGFKCDDNAVCDILRIAKLPNIEIEGIFSHFAASESNADYTKEQFERFMWVVDRLSKRGLEIPIRHICNSGGTLLYPEYHLDMVRCGMLIYGSAPCSTREGAAELAEKYGILPTLSLKSRVSHVKTIYKGDSVGYSRNFIASADMEIATVPLGYGDGISRALSNKGKVLINGRVCPVVGNVCMDQFMVDATAAGACVGDEVVLIGTQGENSISAVEMAAWYGTINYELLTGLSARLVRYYG